jgi:leucyl aminopeptidase
MKIQLVTKPLSEISLDYVVLPIFEAEKPPFNGIVGDFISENPKFGKLYESQLLYSKNRKLLLIGTGKREKLNFQALQNWVGTAVKMLSKKTKGAAIFLPAVNDLTSEEAGMAVSLGAEIALYEPALEYKTDNEKVLLNTLEVVVLRADKGYQDGVKKGLIVADGINFARKLGDKPANEMTPSYFLKQAQKVAKENKIRLIVLDEKQAKKKGMGCFVGVSQGSDEPSFMIALEYKGDIKTKDKWGIVGKGITFDSGGISIKPDNKMWEMKYDMSGAAAVLAIMQIIAKLGLKSNIVGIMAVTENLPSGRALKPGDILRSYSGKSVEVDSTDAEGRLVLIDGLTFAQTDFKATKLIDLATLTGACVVALGDFITGAFSNSPKFVRDVVLAGSQVGEKLWEMPMDEEFDEMVRSEIADIHNTGKGGSMGHRTAGSITAAKFLEAVIENKKPWVHLDIAGTAWDLSKKPYRSPGATGAGIKTLVKILMG